MPNSRFNGASLRKFDDTIEAWQFVCMPAKSFGAFAPNPVASMQSLPPPAGFFLPPPMTFDNRGNLVPIERRPNHSVPVPVAPLSLATRDNASLDEDPVSRSLISLCAVLMNTILQRGVCLRDRVVRYLSLFTHLVADFRCSIFISMTVLPIYVIL